LQPRLPRAPAPTLTAVAQTASAPQGSGTVTRNPCAEPATGYLGRDVAAAEVRNPAPWTALSTQTCTVNDSGVPVEDPTGDRDTVGGERVRVDRAGGLCRQSTMPAGFGFSRE
jgi:hypothetical protein